MVSQLASLHSSVSWVSVGRRVPVAGRCFEDTEAVRDGRWRGLFSLLLLSCLSPPPPADFLAFGAGLAGAAGAVVLVVVGAAGGCRDVLGAESALLLDAAV